jgi:hypothetical protein
LLTSFIGHAGRRGWRVLAGVLLCSFYTLVGGCRADEHDTNTDAVCRLVSGAAASAVVGLKWVCGIWAFCG